MPFPRNDLTGQRFGKQVVLRELGGDYVEIQCDCGVVKKSRKQYIVNGQSKSCGCGRYASRSPEINAGDRYAKLVVVQKLGTNGVQRELLCLCDCGNHKVVRESDFRRGDTKSCGCFRQERMSKLMYIHGQGGSERTSLYRAWEGMRRRVSDPKRYPSYKGISVHPAWDSDFVAFRDYIEKNLPAKLPYQSLDRINNMKGYEPGNLRWASAKQQANNRKSPVRRTRKKGSQ